MARTPYADAADLPEEHRHLIDSALQGRPLNVYRALGGNPPILVGIRAFLRALWADTGLDERRRELVILAVARELDSRYEWHQHVRIARDAGVSDAAVLAIARGRLDALDEIDRSLVRYARAVVRGTVDDERHDAVCEAYDESAVVGVAALAGGYLLVGRLIDAFDVELEEPFVGWELERGYPAE